MDTCVFLKLSATFLCGSLLSACGSGGESNSQPSVPVPPPPPPVFEVNVESIVEQIAESGTSEITYIFSGAQSPVTAELNVNSSDHVDVEAFATINDSSGVVTIDVSEMEYASQPFDVDIIFTDEDGRSQSFTHNIQAINTSGERAREEYHAFIAASEEYMAFNSEATLLERITKLSAMATGAFRPELNNIRDTIDLDMLKKFEETLGLKESDLSHYDKGNGTESIFSLRKDELMSIAKALNTSALETLNFKISETESLLPIIADNGVFFSLVEGTLSPFIGNLELGEYTEDGWSFRREYQFLNDIVFANESMCTK